MNELTEQLRDPFSKDKEYRAAYAESFMHSVIAAQIKALREQRELSQQELADLIGTKQAGISRLENINYTAWKVETLTRLARAFDVRLRITFEEFGTLPDEVDRFGRKALERAPFVEDPVFGESASLREATQMRLTKGEQNALANIVEFSQKKKPDSTRKEKNDENNVDPSSQSTGLYGTRRTEPWGQAVSS